MPAAKKLKIVRTKATSESTVLPSVKVLYPIIPKKNAAKLSSFFHVLSSGSSPSSKGDGFESTNLTPDIRVPPEFKLCANFAKHQKYIYVLLAFVGFSFFASNKLAR
jgi:hypothetical protein